MILDDRIEDDGVMEITIEIKIEKDGGGDAEQT